jgi:2-polyprenyl-6-methoxyphenol hydroxylase-like FAD-dependent oxidoreductase
MFHPSCSTMKPSCIPMTDRESIAQRSRDRRASQRHVEICGAGICGLTTGLLFRKHGWSVTIHERAPEIREVGAGIGLHASALRVFERLGIFDEVLARGRATEAVETRDSRGRVIANKQLEEHLRQIAASRQVLISILLAASVDRGVDIRTSSEGIEGSQDGRLTLSNGSTREADLVIAADGWRSQVRDSLNLAKTVRLRRTGATRAVVGDWSGVIGDWPERVDRGVLTEYWGSKRRVGIVPIAVDQVYLYLACLEADEAGKQIPLNVDIWASAFPGIPRSVFGAVAQTEARHDPYPYVRLKQWSVGRVAILGDALHAMPATLGLGVGLGLWNAHLLVTELDHHEDVPNALSAWEAKCRGETERVQRWSVFREQLAGFGSKPMVGLRTRMLRKSGGLRGWSKGRQIDRTLDRLSPKESQMSADGGFTPE